MSKIAFGLNEKIGLPLLSIFVAFLTMPLVVPCGAGAQSHSHESKPAADVAENEVLDRKALEILEAARKGQFERVRAAVAPQLAERLSVDDIRRIWKSTIETTGPVEKVLAIRSIHTVNADLVFIKTQFQKGSGEFIFTFNDRGQVVGVDFPAIGTIEEIARIVIQSLADNDFVGARGYLHAFLKTEIYPQQVQEKWQQLLEKTGDFKGIKSVTVRPGSQVDGTDVVLVTVEFARVTEDIFVIFDDNRRITGIDVPEGSR